MIRKRSIDAFFWVAPLLVCLALFHRGLFAWFVQDDFGSILLALRTRTVDDALRWLVQPLGQGVLRPLPDAYFYIVLHKLAGLNALPYRIAVFATQFANLLLLTAIARRLCGSRWRGLTAAMVWAVNIALVVGMVWTSAYSQILCCFFWLAAFHLFLLHVETGLWRYWWLQVGAFVLGLGTLEVMVAYPFLALLYCLLLAREHLWKAVPLSAAAALYAAASLWLVPRAAGGPYAMHFDAAIMSGLWHYWTVALGTKIFTRDMKLGEGWLWILSLLLTAGLAWGAAAASPNRRRAAMVGLAWFLLALAPVLPLRDQRMDYYLTAPAIGLGILAASALSALPKWAAWTWLALYTVCSTAFIPAGVSHWYERSQIAKRVVEDVQEARAENPEDVLLLSGVTDAVFYSVIYDQGPAAGGVTNVFLMPDTKITPRPGFRPPEQYRLTATAVEDVLRRGDAEVFHVAPDGDLQPVEDPDEDAKENNAEPGPEEAVAPSWVDLGVPAADELVSAEWWKSAGGVRWMARKGEVRLRAPRRSGLRLRLRAYDPNRPERPVRLEVSANGIHLGTAVIRDAATVEHVFTIPDSLPGLPDVAITLEADHTFRKAPDVRDLSVPFGVMEIN